MSDPVNLADFEALARKVLPKPAFDFFAGAAANEITARENRRAFDDIDLYFRVLAGVEKRDLSVTLFGEKTALPILILLAAAVAAVVVCRLLALPPIIGYLVVGIALGPSTLGAVPDDVLTHRLAEFGVVFLMFSIGLEFSLSKLRVMRREVFGLGLAQVAITIAASMQDRQGIPMLRFEHRNSTACSILNRMPLLTTEIYDFISSLAPELLVTADQPIKSLEVAAMRGMVPGVILSRKERAGFPVPVTEWLDELAPWVNSYMGEVELFPFLLGNRVRQIWQRVRINNSSVPAAFLIWRWVFLAGWLRHCAVRFD